MAKLILMCPNCAGEVNPCICRNEWQFCCEDCLYSFEYEELIKEEIGVSRKSCKE